MIETALPFVNSLTRPMRALLRSQILRDEVPIQQFVAESFEKSLPSVAVVEVVRMLPYVAREQRHVGSSERRLRVGRLHDLALAFGEHEPRPAGTELGQACLNEISPELIPATEAGDQ